MKTKETCKHENDKEKVVNSCNCDNCQCDNEDINYNSCSCGDDCHCNEEEILVLKDNIKHLEEKVMLAKAELINYRKRKDEETSNLLKYSNLDLILEILPVLDNFERAIKSNSNKEFESYIEGFKLIYNNLSETLKKFGVEEINAIDCVFDHNLHEAVMMGEDHEKENDIILEVFSKGYTLKGRVIRPSKVKVNKIN